MLKGVRLMINVRNCKFQIQYSTLTIMENREFLIWPIFMSPTVLSRHICRVLPPKPRSDFPAVSFIFQTKLSNENEDDTNVIQTPV